MNSTTTIDVPIGSGVDLLIGILIIIGGVVGYKRGVIVECISFFSVLVLLTICVNISKSVFKYLTPRSDVPDLFAIILMTVIFIAGLVFVVSRVNFKTSKAIEGTTSGSTYRTLGGFFGGLKFYFISAVFLVTLFKIDEHAKFLPDSAKYSRLSRGSIWIVTSIFPYLQLDKKEPRQFEYPTDNSSKTK
ncbi:MAG: CvpA family protein [Bacteroidales bacterium]|jgi:uncharacterized membrane protein required for colicin V production|nr:CvpA family protein [Bacteroidales bacterium]MBR6279215.1 CvpA family protein [Bacteroidales bacterium]